MPYKAKTLSGAERRVRQLEKKVEALKASNQELAAERLILAKLSAETPQFYNPFDIISAKEIRNRILKGY